VKQTRKKGGPIRGQSGMKIKEKLVNIAEKQGIHLDLGNIIPSQPSCFGGQENTSKMK
jgi:hypothetical protein